MNHTECAITRVDGVDDDAKCVDIVDFRERQALLLHLAVDAVQVLFAPEHMRDEALFPQAPFQAVADLGDDFLAVAADALDFLLDDAVAHRVERGEAEFLEFEADPVDAETLRDRRVDIEGFTCYTAALDRGEGAERAHVVQAIGELDEDDTDIVRHRHEHFLKIRRLLFGVRFEFDLREFAQTVDDRCDLVAKLRTDFFLAGFRVFDNVMQHRRDERVVVHVHFGEDVRDFERVLDVRFAALAQLPGMGVRAEFVGAPDFFYLFFGIVRTDAVAEVVNGE